MDLENLTTLTMAGFDQTTRLLRIFGNAKVQIHMGLDFVLASQGGLCHVIGEKCCTWAPEDLDNMKIGRAHV